MMELRQVRYFVAVVDTGSFTAAAESMSIVQSAVSQQISRLERSVGSELFDRSRRSVRLTAAGRVFEPYARSLLDTESAALRALAPPATSGPTRIGVSTGLAPLLTTIVNAMPDGHLPGPVEIISAGASDREKRVADGDLDAAIVRTASTRSDLVAYALPADELVVVAAAGHPVVASSPVSLSDLADYPLIFTIDAVGNPVSTNTIAACRRAHIEPRVHVLSPGADALSALTTIPNSWSVFFEAHARQLNTDAIGVQFAKCTDCIAVAKSVMVRRDRTDLGARIAAAITDREKR